MTADLTYYEILGVPEDAPPTAISKAYRELAKVVHPDGSRPDEARFKQIERAHAVLSDDVKRMHYDATLRSARRAETERSRTASAEKEPVRELPEGADEGAGAPSTVNLAAAEQELTTLHRRAVAWSIGVAILKAGSAWWGAFVPLAFVTQFFAGYGPSRGHGGGFGELMAWVHLFGLVALAIVAATAWKALEASGRTRLVVDEWLVVTAAWGFAGGAVVAIVWFLATGGPDRGNWFIGPLGAILGLGVACHHHWTAPRGSKRTEGDRVALSRAEAARQAEADALHRRRVGARARINRLESEARQLLPLALEARHARDFEEIRLVSVPRTPIRLGRRKQGAYELCGEADLLLLTDQRLMVSGLCTTLRGLVHEVRRAEGVGWPHGPSVPVHHDLDLDSLEHVVTCLRHTVRGSKG